jgi:hypothetical protein
MIIRKNDIAIVISNKEDSMENFFVDFSKNYINFKNDNLILDFSDLKGVKTENILLFLQHSEEHRNNGMSFVIVVNGIDADKVPDEIVTVPTISEAEDIIEMENIERDLGF